MHNKLLAVSSIWFLGLSFSFFTLNWDYYKAIWWPVVATIKLCKAIGFIVLYVVVGFFKSVKESLKE